ncbi:MAG: ABC transporter substrate-binding protein [Formivibrio sp.]|nr:ABC transporter substrate-binding protein [Formivibrio sp.]
MVCKLGLFGATLVSTLVLSMGVRAETVKMLSIEPNIAEGKTYYANIKKAFEAQNPGIEVQIEYLDSESYKTKLPTLLQSKSRPDIFFTWSGGVFYEQAKAGILKDISAQMNAGWKDSFSTAGVNALTYQGKVYGAPMYAANVVLWYNKKLLEQAKVDPKGIKTWDDFLNAVKAVKAAGITPVVVGGKDKWPLQFYYGYLATRIAGKDGIAAAGAGQNGGFADKDFVRAGDEFKRLIDLKPFQPGFMDATAPKAGGLFGDGKAAFHLMGNWDYGTQQKNSTSGHGVGDANLGVMPFPMVTGGHGAAGDTFGGINGWLVTKDATDASIKWLKFLLNQQNQQEGGRLALWLPIGKGANAGISNPFMKEIAGFMGNSSYHQLYLDQALGANVGAAVNDAAAELATGDLSPNDAAKRIEEARKFR